jgi:hypothetical protein
LLQDARREIGGDPRSGEESQVINRRQKLVLALGIVGAAALIARPPYFGIDRESAGKLHSVMGYRWIWDPPSPAEVYARLTGDEAGGVDRARLAAFEAEINVVRWIRDAVAMGAAVALPIWLLRGKTRARDGG